MGRGEAVVSRLLRCEVIFERCSLKCQKFFFLVSVDVQVVVSIHAYKYSTTTNTAWSDKYEKANLQRAMGRAGEREREREKNITNI